MHQNSAFFTSSYVVKTSFISAKLSKIFGFSQKSVDTFSTCRYLVQLRKLKNFDFQSFLHFTSRISDFRLFTKSEYKLKVKTDSCSAFVNFNSVILLYSANTLINLQTLTKASVKHSNLFVVLL